MKPTPASKKIRMLLTNMGKTQRWLSGVLGYSTPQAFNNKLRANNFSIKDMEQIASKLGVRFIYYFENDDGERF